MLQVLAIVFFAGVMNRITDMMADEGLKLNRYLGCVIGLLYGFLLAYVITHNPVLAELGIAVLLSLLITGKIDRPVHYLGITSMIFFIAIYGINPLNIFWLLIFVLGSVLDEAGNYLADQKKIKGAVRNFFHLRLTMEVITFAVSVFTGFWILFIAMVCYDTGFIYIFPDRLRRKLISLGG